MGLLALSGSSARDSINHRLVSWLASQASAQVPVVRVLDHEAPIFSVDRERDQGVPASMQQLYDQLEACSGLIVAMPEHNGGPPAMFKNAVDWVSRIDRKVFAMPTMLVSTSPGPRGGITNTTHWANLIPYWGATVVGFHALGSFKTAFGEDGPTDPAVRAEFLATLAKLEAAAG